LGFVLRKGDRFINASFLLGFSIGERGYATGIGLGLTHYNFRDFKKKKVFLPF